ncbi:MAG: LysR substrate-binding domain-containing protein, partial [Paenibacillus macerans]|nr:LysR substrate-binding domain-containing protein [Paenibacillus macerans]
FARKSVEMIRETEQAMSRYTSMLEGRLQLGASLTIGEYVLPRLLGPFGQRYPHISIVMKVMNTTQIIEEIVGHQLNFGLVEAPVQHPDMVSEPVMEDELKLIVPAGHPLSGKKTATLEEVVSYPFVLREKGSGTRQVMEAEFKRRGVEMSRVQTVMELGSTGAVKSAVEAGIGITIISPSSVKHEQALGLMEALDIDGVSFKRKFYSIHLKSTLLPVSAVTFLTFLREYGG